MLRIAVFIKHVINAVNNAFLLTSLIAILPIAALYVVTWIVHEAF